MVYEAPSSARLRASWRMMGAGLAFAWLVAHRGGLEGGALALAHASTLLLDPLLNAACRLLVVLWTGYSAAITGSWNALLLVILDAASLAAMGAAIFEPALLYLAQSERARYVHTAWVRMSDAGGFAFGWWLPRMIATVTEWFLLGDLVCQRICHRLHACTKEGERSVVHGKGSAKILAIVVHGILCLNLMLIENLR